MWTYLHCLSMSAVNHFYCFVYFRSPRRKKQRSPTPKTAKVHIGKLTRNVTKEHITEIFSVYGSIRHIEMPTDRIHPNFSRGFAYVEYENSAEAEKAIKYMDGGMLYCSYHHWKKFNVISQFELLVYFFNHTLMLNPKFCNILVTWSTIW